MKATLREVRELIAEALRKAYDILGVPPNATQDQIKKAYRVKAAALHPDRNPGVDTEKEMMQLNVAFNLLADPDKRAQYDTKGDRTLGDAGAPAAAPGAGAPKQQRQRTAKSDAEALMALDNKLVYTIGGVTQVWRKIWIQKRNEVFNVWIDIAGQAARPAQQFWDEASALARVSTYINMWHNDGLELTKKEAPTYASTGGGKQAAPPPPPPREEDEEEYAPPPPQPRAQAQSATAPAASSKKSFMNVEADIMKVWLEGSTLFTQKNDEKVKRMAFDTLEDAQEHEQLVIAGIQAHGYKPVGGKSAGAPAPGPAPSARAAEPAAAPKAAPKGTGAGTGRGGASKDTYKIYGKFKADSAFGGGVAPTHTRYKGHVYGGAADTKFKPNSAAKIAYDANDDTLNVTDPETGHTQKWVKVGEKGS